jgi:hypothetical protein
MRIVGYIIFFAYLLTLPAGAADERYPIGHPDQGLPHPDFVPTPYHEDPNHILNRIFRASFLLNAVPVEVGLALPREHRDPNEFFRTPWYFAVRAGTPADRRLFGGDTRLLPREGFDPSEAAAFSGELGRLNGEAVQYLRSRPELAVLFQHDILRLAERLLVARRNPELLKPLAEAAKKAALPAGRIPALPPTFDLGLKSGSIDFPLPQNLLRTEPPADGPFLEILRNSTRVFDASHTLAWSRVFISWPAATQGLPEFLSARQQDPGAEVPVGTVSVLAQGAVAVDETGRPHATPLVFDLRVKWLANREPLAAGNRTTTRDGIQIRAWELRRASLRQNAYNRLFRPVHDEDQALFRDYGSLKHTTQAAQCTLCHRLHRVPDARLGGFITLNSGAKPRLAVTGKERLRLAEQEVQRLLETLKKTSGAAF